MQPPPGQPDYPAVFRRLVARSVELARDEVLKPDWKPTDDANRRMLHTLGNALQLPAAWPAAFELLRLLAPRMEQAGLRADWLVYLERGIACSRVAADGATTAQLLLAKGILLQRMGQLAEAYRELQQAVHVFARHGDRRGHAVALNRLAYTACLRRLTHAAFASVEAARVLLAEDDVEIGYCHLVLYVLASDRRAAEEAETHALASLACFRRAGERRMTAMALLNLGKAYGLGDRHEAAIRTYQEAIELLAVLDDPSHLALAQMNLGCSYLFLHVPAAAVSPLLSAESTFRRLHDRQRLALAYSNLGLAYAELGDWEQAERHLCNAIERFAMLGDAVAQVDTMIDLACMYLHSGRPMEATATARSVQTGLAQIHSPAERAFQAGKLEALGLL
jgi:tetratricopeptide (TPR) repeat protein